MFRKLTKSILYDNALRRGNSSIHVIPGLIRYYDANVVVYGRGF